MTSWKASKHSVCVMKEAENKHIVICSHTLNGHRKEKDLRNSRKGEIEFCIINIDVFHILMNIERVSLDDISFFHLLFSSTYYDDYIKLSLFAQILLVRIFNLTLDAKVRFIRRDFGLII